MNIDLPSELQKAILDSMQSGEPTPEERGHLLTGLGVSWAEALLLQALSMGRVRIERVKGRGWCLVALDGSPLWALERTNSDLASSN